MNDKQLYQQLLGLNEDWEVTNVEINFSELKVDVFIDKSSKTKFKCPECNKECNIYDTRKERNWRHLDTMQFKTILHCNIPRIDCKDHGIKTVDLSWADKYSRFTNLFERLAINILLATNNQTKTQELLNLSWDEVHYIQKRAVDRGLKRRKNLKTEFLGVDEKSFKKGQSYVTVLYDLENASVIDVREDRKEESLKSLLVTIPEQERIKIKAVAVDMWEAYGNAIKAILPDVDIVFDKFHILSHLSKAVNQVRIEENKSLLKQQIDLLKNTKFIWLTNRKNMSDKQKDLFDDLYNLGLKVATAWNLKMFIQYLWTFSKLKLAKWFFNKWYKEVYNCNLAPMNKVADMFKKHLDNILNYLKYPITNAVAEGINSKIQNIKTTARGFRSFENYRIAILFFCGNLELYPQ
ncbi:MAG: ISL3 family transposase [Candidatus Omnitrophota bacterium]